MDWNFLIRNKDAINVTTDSRKVTPGCVFVALKGEHFDGNAFVEQARETGAEYVIQGDHAVAELQDLARAWRRHWAAMPLAREGARRVVIGITGTNGKTTTKELTACVLGTHYSVHYTQGNLNNSLGVPLTVLQLTREHELAIVEMGASHPGDIRELVQVAEPDCGLITNVGRAHLQGFGSFEGVQATKKELYDYLSEHHGFIFRNTDNAYLARMAGDLYTIPYTTGQMPEGTQLVGAYNAENISAALAIGAYFGVSQEEGLAAVRAYCPTNHRSEACKTDRNSLIIDAYNANPTSMQVAIEAFFRQKTELPKAFILGGMRELGDYEQLEHQNIVNMLLERRAESVWLVGDEYRRTTAPYPIFTDVEQLCSYLASHPIYGYHILVKGSRGNQLEKIIDSL